MKCYNASDLPPDHMEDREQVEAQSEPDWPGAQSSLTLEPEEWDRDLVLRLPRCETPDKPLQLPR